MKVQSLGNQSGSLADTNVNVSHRDAVDTNSCLNKSTYYSVPWISGVTEDKVHCISKTLFLYIFYNNKKREFKLAFDKPLKQSLYYRTDSD